MNLQENIFRIKQIMGVLNEQASSNLVGNDVYQAIKNIESVFGTIDKHGNIEPRADLNGTEREALIKRVIERSIGLDNWAKLDRKLKGQIYSFMFQSDSGVYDKGELIKDTRFRWLAGLAQSIDSSIDRTKIVDKPLNDKNVQNAIKLVKDNIDKIDYQSYINVVETQYDNLSAGSYTDEKKEYIWGPRPDALDKLMSGDSWETVKEWWWNKIDPKKELKGNPYKTTGGPSNTTTNPQQTTNGGEAPTTSSNTTTPTPTGGEAPTTSSNTTTPTPTGGSSNTTTPTPTGVFKYPTIDQSYKPTNGDPWEYAYDGTNLYVRNPKGSNKIFNLKDPNYFTKYPDSKLKNKEKRNKAIESIRKAYGDKLGMQ